MTPVNPKVLDSLNWGISAEIKSYVFYKAAAKQATNQEFRETLLKLAGEEKGHYQILERQHHSLITSEQWISYNDIMKQKALPEINEEMADVHKDLIASVHGAADEREILDIAMDLEKQAYDAFSRAAGRAADPEEKRTFEFLAGFEKTHIKIIQGMIDSL